MAATTFETLAVSAGISPGYQAERFSRHRAAETSLAIVLRKSPQRCIAAMRIFAKC